jgi:tRNA/rRNA methyltransferase
VSFWAYILRCDDGTYYVGHTDELEDRLAAHQAGALPGYTHDRRPVELVWSAEFGDRDEAFEAERRLKGWSRAKKEKLINGDWEGIQALSRKLFLRYTASTSLSGTQDERVVQNSKQTAHPECGPSEVEGRVSKDRGSQISQESAHPECGPSAVEGRVSKDGAHPPIIILVRPQLGQNIGKAARAMLNFGLTELRLVAPRDGWPNPDAGPAASGADLVLARATVFPTLAEAIADCSHVFASTVRRRDLVMPVVGPQEMAEQLHEAAGRTAILFGPERSGLESEDVALADAIVTVPINPEFGSLNLAQAVILLAYEWSRGRPLVQPTAKAGEPPAPHGEVEGMIGQLEEQLDAAGYFWPVERRAATTATLRTILTKPAWSSREVKAMRGVFRALAQPRVRSKTSSS